MSHHIAVAVATCGRPEALARCLGGVAEQTIAAAEVLVIDQAPTTAARAAARAGGARYIEQPRLGLSASRNLALDVATAPVLAVTDDDCRPDPGWVEGIGIALARSPAPGAVTGPVLALDDDGGGSYAVSQRGSQVPLDHAGRVAPWHVGTGANFAAPTELLRRCGGWDERLGVGSPGKAAEDADLLYRLLVDGHVIRYEPAAVIRHARQSRERRLATRWSYGYGIGVMCGLRLVRRDAFALRMLTEYGRMQVRPLAHAIRRGDRHAMSERIRALAGVAPGVVHGLRASAVGPARRQL
jgi:GT2 family glycosyltransferase